MANFGHTLTSMADSMRCNLHHSYEVIFSRVRVSIKRHNVTFAFGIINNGLFQLQFDYCFNCTSTFSLSSGEIRISDSILWHNRLGHIGQDRMSRLVKEGLLGPLSHVQLPKCISCIHCKITWKPFSKASRSTKLLEIIHSDICGPMSVKGRSGALHFITFIDDHSRYGHIYLLTHKS